MYASTRLADVIATSLVSRRCRAAWRARIECAKLALTSGLSSCLKPFTFPGGERVQDILESDAGAGKKLRGVEARIGDLDLREARLQGGYRRRRVGRRNSRFDRTFVALRQSGDLIVGALGFRLRERIGRAAMMPVAPAQYRSQPQDEKTRDQGEQNNVDKRKAVAHDVARVC